MRPTSDHLQTILEIRNGRWISEHIVIASSIGACKSLHPFGLERLACSFEQHEMLIALIN